MKGNEMIRTAWNNWVYIVNRTAMVIAHYEMQAACYLVAIARRWFARPKPQATPALSLYAMVVARRSAMQERYDLDAAGRVFDRILAENRATRLQTIKDRWFTEPLAISFPSLGVDMTNPRTCAEFVTSPRIITGDDAANLEHFGVADPKAVLASLSAQFEAITSGQADPKILKDTAVVLDVFKADSYDLAAHFAPDTNHRDDTLNASYSADAKAAERCQAILTALATELGISLPTKDTRRLRG